MLRITGSTSPSEQLPVPSAEELTQLREEFRRRHHVLLPGLLDFDLADDIARRVEHSDFYRLEHEGIGVEACMTRNATLAWLLLLVNDVRFLEIVRSISGCDPIGHFQGRVYRLEPAADHYDSWHTDLGEGRMVAMSINLGTRSYEGGALEIRERPGGATVKAKNARMGDGLLFALGEQLEHRVMPVTGDTPRTVFAGWFKAGPSFLSLLPSYTVPRAAVAVAGADPEASSRA